MLPVGLRVSDERRFGRFDPARSLRDAVNPFVLDPDIEDAPPLPTHPTLPHVVLIFIGGFVGTLLRYLVLKSIHTPTPGFPWPVFTINVSGAFALGVFGATLFARRPGAISARLFIATGILGGWTTYSSVIAGILTLAHVHSWDNDFLVFAGALLVPVLAAGLGIALGEAAVSRKPS